MGVMREVSVTIDGTPVPAEDIVWSAVIGGYDVATATIREHDAKRLPTSVRQGSQFTVYTEDGVVRYQGRLATDPTSNNDGTYSVKANGHKARVEKANSPLRYQTRDYSKWVDRGGDPHNQSGGSGGDVMEMVIGDGSVRWGVPPESIGTGGEFIAFWGEGTLLHRLAFNWGANATSPNFDIRVASRTGPTGATALTVDTNISTLTGTIDYTPTVANRRDQLDIGLYRNAAGTAARFRLRITNLRVWGDRMTTNTAGGLFVLTDIATLAKLDPAGIGSGLTGDIMPLWADEGESWADVMSYVCMLYDGWWRILDDRGKGPYLEAGTWANSRNWTVTARGSHRQLTPQEKFNKVTVTYPGSAGRTRTTSATAAVPSLDAHGLVNEYPLELGDVQAAATLASSLATNTVAYLSKDRYEGTLEVVEAHDSAGRDDPYGILPGDTITIADFDQNQSLTLRVTAVQATPLGVSVSVGGDFLPTERIEAQAALKSARARMASRIKRNRGFFDFTGARAVLYRRMLKTDAGQDTPNPRQPKSPTFRQVNRLRRMSGRSALKRSTYRRRFH